LRIKECDILLGILWRRLGAGTQHEIRLAYEAWNAGQRPQIMLYFGQRCCFPTSEQDAQDLARVLRFKEEFDATNVFRWVYKDLADFRRAVKEHLKRQAVAIAKERKPAAVAAKRRLSCFAAADLAPVRAEGLAEIMGDIVLSFTGADAAPTAATPDQFDVEVSLNVNMTSPRAGGHLDGPALIPERADGTAASSPIRARQVGNVGLRFEDVPIGPRLRITNIRANAFQLRPASGPVTPARATAYVAVQPKTPTAPKVTVINPVVTIGRPEPGFDFSVRSRNDGEGAPFPFVRADSGDSGLGTRRKTIEPVTSFNVKFREQYPDSFKTRDQEAGTSAQSASSASSGTRFLVRLYDVPNGVRVFATTRDVLPGTTPPAPGRRFLKAVLVSGTDANGNGGPGPVAGVVPSGVAPTATEGPVVELPVHSGFGFAVWEWVSDDPSSPTTSEEVSFRVLLVVAPGEEPAGLVSVSGTLAPLSTVSTADPSAPVPRFIDTGPFVPAFLFPAGKHFTAAAESARPSTRYTRGMDNSPRRPLTDPDLIKARDQMCAEIRAFFESRTWPNGSKIRENAALFAKDPTEMLSLKLRFDEIERRLLEVEKKLMQTPPAA
jgi:hypothetical protein